MRPLLEEQACLWYEDLENDLIAFMKVVPAQGDNLKVWSPALATVVAEGCALIDSLFRFPLPSLVAMNGKRRKRDKLTISNYRETYETRYHLSDRKVVVLTSPTQYCAPWFSWLGNSRGSPQWWQIHNDLKHQRLGTQEKATLTAAIETLAGALVVLTATKEILPTLAQRGWFNPGQYNLEFALTTISAGVGYYRFTVETGLFVVLLSSDPLPTTLDEVAPVVFGSQRLMRHLLRWT
jgi:hypothetical protein